MQRRPRTRHKFAALAGRAGVETWRCVQCHGSCLPQVRAERAAGWQGNCRQKAYRCTPAPAALQGDQTARLALIPHMEVSDARGWAAGREWRRRQLLPMSSATAPAQPSTPLSAPSGLQTASCCRGSLPAATWVHDHPSPTSCASPSHSIAPPPPPRPGTLPANAVHHAQPCS